MPSKKSTRRSFGRVQKLPSGRYRARYVGPDGNLHSGPHSYSAKMDAEGWLATEHRLIDLGTWTPPKSRGAMREATSRTVTQAVEDYITSRDITPGSAETYRSLLATRIDPYLGTMTVGELTRHDVEKWTQKMLGDHNTRSRNSQAYRLLSSTMKRELDKDVIEVSPCQSPEAGRKPKPTEKPLLTDEEYKALVAALPEHYRLMARVMASCALRLGEVTELRVSDYRTVSADPLIATLSVSRAASWVEGAWHVGRPKSEAGVRTVTVPPSITEVLREHVATRKRKAGTDALIFPNKNGTRVRPQGFRSTFSVAAAKAGRPDVSPHSFRHYGAVQAARAGGTVKELMDRLGHETPDMAIHYQHTAAGRDAEIAALMSDAFDE